MITMRLLDFLLLATMLVAPWVLLVCALAPFRERLRREWRFFALVAAVAWGLLLLVFSPLTETLQQAVIHVTAEPWFAAYRDAVLTTPRAPLWLPNFALGLPALAHPYTGYFSPFTSLLLFFRDVTIGVNVLLFVHLAFAAVSLAVLLREAEVPRTAALLAGVALVWNPWVFRRLGAEVHALYLFGFAYVPLAWALLLRFLRREHWTDAARAGIPLGFMAVSMVKVFAQMTFVVGFFLVAAGLGALVRRQPARVRRLLFGAIALGAAAFLTAAPEHLATSELIAVQGSLRLPDERVYGWRDRDLSTAEFIRLLLPNDVGRMLMPVRHSLAYFGVPFSPGDLVVGLAVVGAVAAARRPRWRHSLRPGAHLILFLLLATVATHGLAYEPLQRFHPLWSSAGNWPVLGSLLLFPLALFAGAGAAAVGRAVRASLRILTAWISVLRAVPERALATSVFAVLGVAAAVELLWGVTAVLRDIRSADPKDRAQLRFTVATQRLEDLERLPHVARLKALARTDEAFGRIFCIGDRGVWPSPCFDDRMARHGLELLGVAELGWAVPQWAIEPLGHLWSAWEGTLSPPARTLLELANVTHVVSTRRLALPLIEEVEWGEIPADTEIGGAFLARAIGGGPWREGWDQVVRIHALPSVAPRAFFADAVLLDGSAEDAERVMGEALSGKVEGFHPRKIALLYPSTSGRRAVSNLPALSARPDGATARVRFFRDHPTRAQPVRDFKVRVRRLHPGAWELTGEAPRDGAVVLSQLFYPGFRAWVNGEAAPVLRSQLMLAAVPVAAGEFRVRIEYAPGGLYAAGLLTLGFALAMVLITRREFRAGLASDMRYL